LIGTASEPATSLTTAMLMRYKVIKLAAQREASGMPQLFLGDDNSNIDYMETDIHYPQNLSYRLIDICKHSSKHFHFHSFINGSTALS
jgi:hypothetical protein